MVMDMAIIPIKAKKKPIECPKPVDLSGTERIGQRGWLKTEEKNDGDC